MTTEPGVDAARARIQRLVEEIAALSKGEVSSEDFFQQFLTKACEASDAEGGAVWLLNQRPDGAASQFQLAAQRNLESSLFHSDEKQRSTLSQFLGKAAMEKSAVVLPPGKPGDPLAALTNPNATPFPYFHLPLLLNGQTLGVLQVWLKPYVRQGDYAEFSNFLAGLCAYVEQHFRSRRMGNLVVETQRLQQLLKFSTDLAGSLDAVEIARLAANYGRDLLGCDRCAVLLREHAQWRVLAVSGQEQVERKSALVKSMARLVEARAAETPVVLTRAEPAGDGDSGAPAAQAVEADEIERDYFEASHLLSALVCPILDDDKEITGAIFAESSTKDFFNSREEAGPGRIAGWLAVHTGKTIAAAREHQTLPLLRSARIIRAVKRAALGPERHRFFAKVGGAVFVFVLVAFWPVGTKVDGDCMLLPVHRAAVVPEVPGRVERVLVRGGDQVKKGQIVAELDTSRLQTELDAATQERLRHVAEMDRHRAEGDESAAQLAMLRMKIADAQLDRIRADIEHAKLRAPIDGEITTKNPELRVNEVLQPGMVFAEIQERSRWELQIEVNEKRIGDVERALQSEGALPASYILYSLPSEVLRTRLERRQQISAMAYPKEKESVFLISIEDPGIPAELAPRLRSGLTGRAKIETGSRPLLVSLFAGIYRWFQMRWIG